MSERKSWDEIHDNIAHGSFWQNRDNNYITPADELARMKTRDRDHDGRADLLDRLYDFDTFDVAGDTQTAFVPNDPSARNRVLVGERLHNAVQFLNVTLGFSHFLDHLEKGNPFVSAGFFTPGPGDEQKIFQVEKRKLDIASTGASPEHTFDKYGGRAFDIYEVKLNPVFAHMSEEVLKAALFYEVAMQQGSGRTPADRALQGLLLVAHGLTTDSEYGREQMIFDELKRTLGLPKGLVYAEASRYLKADEHVYAGSDASLAKWKAGLSDDVKRALDAAVAPPGVS